jgi:hypothetical protein
MPVGNARCNLPILHIFVLFSQTISLKVAGTDLAAYNVLHAVLLGWHQPSFKHLNCASLDAVTVVVDSSMLWSYLRMWYNMASLTSKLSALEDLTFKAGNLLLGRICWEVTWHPVRSWEGKGVPVRVCGNVQNNRSKQIKVWQHWRTRHWHYQYLTTSSVWYGRSTKHNCSGKGARAHTHTETHSKKTTLALTDTTNLRPTQTAVNTKQKHFLEHKRTHSGITQRWCQHYLTHLTYVCLELR